MTIMTNFKTISGAAATAALLVAAPGAAAKKPTPPGGGKGGGANAITLAAQPNPLSFASFVTLSGRLTGGSNGAEGVTLQADPYPFADNGFADKTTSTTAANGTYSFRQAPSLNTRYRVVASTSPKVTSPVVGVSVAYRVGLSVSDSTPRRGTRVRFSGSVGPRKDGSTAFIQKRRSDGRFVTVARATLVAGTASRSVYSKRLLIRASGTYRVRVTGDAAHVAGNSRSRSLAVH